MNPLPLLTVADLSIAFTHDNEKTPAWAVRKASFCLGVGETLVIVGESGSGKSTLAKSLLGLLPNNTKKMGHAFLNVSERTTQKTTTSPGRVHSKKPPAINLTALSEKDFPAVRGNLIGFMPQEPMVSLNPLYTIQRQITETFRQDGVFSKDAEKKRLTDLFDSVDYPDGMQRLQAYPHQLSGGQRQRVLAAIAIARRPHILIADEPTTALDAATQVIFLNQLKTIQEKTGMSLILITHHLGLAGHYGDRVLVMEKGSIVEQGPITVLRTPKHAYTRKLSAALNAHIRPKEKPEHSTSNLLTVQNLSVFSKTPHSYRMTTFLSKAPLWLRSFMPTPKTLVHNLSFTLGAGQTLGVLGTSGSGKTTLAKGLLRLMPTRGSVHLADLPWLSLSPRQLRAQRRLMQYVFQDPFGSLNPRFLVEDTIREGLVVHEKAAHAQHTKKINAALSDVGLDTSFAQRYPHELSGGQRQRVAIARAIILRPKLLILDEPTTSLDLMAQEAILTLLQHLQQEYDLSYLLISHDRAVLQRLSHKILLMHQGKALEETPAQDFFKKPKTALGADLLAASEKLLSLPLFPSGASKNPKTPAL